MKSIELSRNVKGIYKVWRFIHEDSKTKISHKPDYYEKMYQKALLDGGLLIKISGVIRLISWGQTIYKDEEGKILF